MPPTLPTFARSAFQEAVAADTAALRAAGSDVGTDAIYQAGGAGDGVLVRVHVSDGGLAARKPSVREAAGPTGRQRSLTLSVAAAAPGAALTLGVAADGAIGVVRPGDLFTVAGANAGRPDLAGVPLRVTGEVHLVAGVKWNAEVRP
jgi:hypothetical protein